MTFGEDFYNGEDLVDYDLPGCLLIYWLEMNQQTVESHAQPVLIVYKRAKDILFLGNEL